MTEEITVAKVACMGLRISADNSLCYAWAYLDEKGEPKDLADGYILFKKAKGRFPLTSKPNIGDIYPIKKADGMTSITGPLERMDWDHPKLREWKLESRACEARHIAAAQAAKLDLGDLTLTEIQTKMRNTIGRAKRTALLMAVVEFVS